MPFRGHRSYVSLLATMANPAQVRVDTWHRLEDAAQRLALASATESGEGAALVEEVNTLLAELEAYERYWLFPGSRSLEVLRNYLVGDDVEWLARGVRLAVHLLSEYGDQASLFDLDAPLAEQETAVISGRQHFVTVLLADDTPAGTPQALADELRRLRDPGDDIVFELLVVTNVEDALAAAALNSEIQACIIRQDLPMKSVNRLPILDRLINVNQSGTGRGRAGMDAGTWLRELRPHIDLYLLTDESVATRDSRTHDLFDRTFYRLNDPSELHSTVLAGVRRRYQTPFFDALRAYAAAPVGQFHALPVARGASIFNSRWLQDMGEFYGRNIFLAETSSTAGGLDSLLEPHGAIRDAKAKAAETWGSRSSYFVTNGTSTANKIVMQALTRPEDIVLIDRNCHKSHHYGLVLAGAMPMYLDAYPLQDFAIYGGVPLRTIKKALLDLKAVGRLDHVRMVLLTNCTFDGITYNPQRFMDEILAIKPDICFLWDEAWYAFAVAVPFARQRTAMSAAAALERRYASATYKAEYAAWREEVGDLTDDEMLETRLMPDPAKARLRVYATHSTHKSLSALRQGSMIHVWDQDFDRLARETFSEAFLTHTSTSPNQQLLATLDLARRQVDLEGYGMVRGAYQMALAFRARVTNDPLLRKWFRLLDQTDLIPSQYCESGAKSYYGFGASSLELWDQAWRDDEFVLDPTRTTLYVAETGINGFDFRNDVLMERYGIQINKTSINSVLLIFTIGVTWSSVQYLLDALRLTAESLERHLDGSGKADRLLRANRIRALTEELPPLPDFSEFDPAFRPAVSREGDMRDAFYCAYDENNRDYVRLAEAPAVLISGRNLVSTTFVVPYPPGFPVLVPGQVVSAEILNFLLQLDVHEIHGYRPDLGLAVFTEDALNRYAERKGRQRGRRPVLGAPSEPVAGGSD